MIAERVALSTGKTGNAERRLALTRRRSPTPQGPLQSRKAANPVKHTTPTLSVDSVTPCTSGAYDPDTWYGETREDVTEAMEACSRCPQLTRCLEAALERREPAGVWGGQRFRRGKVTTTMPTARRGVDLADPSTAGEPDASHELDTTDDELDEPEPKHRRKTDTDPDRVERAVEAVLAGLLGAGDGLTMAERRAVIARTYPKVARSVVAEVLGISVRTVDRWAAAQLDPAREAA